MNLRLSYRKLQMVLRFVLNTTGVSMAKNLQFFLNLEKQKTTNGLFKNIIVDDQEISQSKVNN